MEKPVCECHPHRAPEFGDAQSERCTGRYVGDNGWGQDVKSKRAKVAELAEAPDLGTESRVTALLASACLATSIRAESIAYGETLFVPRFPTMPQYVISTDTPTDTDSSMG